MAYQQIGGSMRVSSSIAIFSFSFVLLHTALGHAQQPAGDDPPASDVAPADIPPSDAATSEASAGELVGIRGAVLDEQGTPLVATTIEVQGSDQVAITEADGTFELALPPGNYRVRVFFPLYKEAFYDVTVPAGGAAALAVTLSADEDSGEVIVSEGKVDKRSEAVQLSVRKNADTVSDTLSAEEISRAGDSSAADAVKRVVSVSVQGGKYVVLRGLGDRYVTTLLNGVPLPSPEPDRQAVPLDLFPTSLLSNLTVLKSYSVSLPGTFGGGTMVIDTNSYPSERTVKVKLSTSVNSESTFQDIALESAGGLDVFGFDDGARSLPDIVPDVPVQANGPNMTEDEVERIGESFSSAWGGDDATATPNFGFGASVGDTIDVGQRRLGYLATVTFGHKLRGRESFVAKTRNSGGELEYREELESVTGQRSANLGVLGNTGYSPATGHNLNLLTLYTHNGQSIANTVSGFSETDGMDVEATRLEFVERALSFTQLTGSHRLGDNLELSWQGNLSFSSRDEKDTRNIIYNFLPDGTAIFKDQPGSGERFFSELSETSFGAGSNLTVPLSKVELRVGATAQRSERDFSARRFRFKFIGDDNSVRRLGPEEIFSAENIGPSFMLEERTLESDAYDSTLDVLGTYAGATVAATDKLRLVGGIRFERSDQELVPGSPFAVAGSVGSDVMTDRTDSDWLPAANAVYALTDAMNMRAAYSYTLARPKFRELAPFLFFDYVRRRSVSGNPELATTRIHNGDLRWEWFLGDREVLAVSGFYKRFSDPIERVIVSASGGDSSFANAASAQAYGTEVEARLSLARISSLLRDVFVGTNIALIRSRIELTDEQQMSQTSLERPMQGQSPYVVNASLTYANPKIAEITVLYNVIGQRITDVGFDSLPDVYEQPFHKLNLTARRALSDQLDIKLSLDNLLGSSVELEQGELPVLLYEAGFSGAISVEWKP